MSRPLLPDGCYGPSAFIMPSPARLSSSRTVSISGTFLPETANRSMLSVRHSRLADRRGNCGRDGLLHGQRGGKSTLARGTDRVESPHRRRACRAAERTARSSLLPERSAASDGVYAKRTQSRSSITAALFLQELVSLKFILLKAVLLNCNAAGEFMLRRKRMNP